LVVSALNAASHAIVTEDVSDVTVHLDNSAAILLAAESAPRNGIADLRHFAFWTWHGTLRRLALRFVHGVLWREC
jgi:hypothetical protein